MDSSARFAKNTSRANSSASFSNPFNFQRQHVEYLQQGSKTVPFGIEAGLILRILNHSHHYHLYHAYIHAKASKY